MNTISMSAQQASKPSGIFLANAAIRQAEKHSGVLTAEILCQLALAHVATWISTQDPSIQSTAIMENAQAAMDRIYAHFAKVCA